MTYTSWQASAIFSPRPWCLLSSWPEYIPSTLHRNELWQASASLCELFERVFDLIGQIEQELGLSLDVGERTLKLDRGQRELARLDESRSTCSSTGVAESSASCGAVAWSDSVLCSAHGRSPSSSGLSAEPSTMASRASHTSPTKRMFWLSMPQIGRVHLDQLPDEDPRARVRFGPVAVGIGQGGADQIIHELELTANRDAQPGKLGLLGGFWFRSELRHPDCVPNQWLDAKVCMSVRAGCPFRAATPGFAEGPRA